MLPPLPRIAVTAGEPAGIGPELVAALAATDLAADLIAIGDADLLRSAAQQRGIELHSNPIDGTRIVRRAAHSLRCIDIPLRAPATPGQLDVRNAAYVIETLARAADGCIAGEFDAVVTAPVQKSMITDAGIAFTGHTEFFAERAHCDVVMLLVAPRFTRCARDHAPAAGRGPGRDHAESAATHCAHCLQRPAHEFGIAAPRIAVLGLNPHAGEGGHLGREEIDTIIPALAGPARRGHRARRPTAGRHRVPAGAACEFDAVLAMYHDQGLPVLKALGFGDAVNVTLGLPFVRTSVDHGTALDLAGSGRADASSMIAAAKLALELIR